MLDHVVLWLSWIIFDLQFAMAEESSSSQHVVGVPEGVSMEAITNQLLSGQSKYKSDDIVEYKWVESKLHVLMIYMGNQEV